MLDLPIFTAMVGDANEAEKSGQPARIPTLIKLVCNVGLFIYTILAVIGLVIIEYCICFFLSLL